MFDKLSSLIAQQGSRVPVMEERSHALPGVTFGIPGAETWGFANAFATGQPLSQGGNVITEPYAHHPTIAVAIGTISEDAGSIEWEAFSRDSKGLSTDKPIEDHDVLKIWRQPNPIMQGNQLWIGTYVCDQHWGEVFWYYPDLVLDRPDNPQIVSEMLTGGRLDLLDPRSIKIKMLPDGKLQHIFKGPAGSEEILNSDKLTHFKRYNPYNPLRGLPKLTSLIAEIAGDSAAARWNERFFSSQNGIPSGLLLPSKREADLTPKQRDEVLGQFSQRHGGTKRSVGVLPAGWTWQDLGITQREMDFKELRDYSREQILGVFGVPPFRAGVLDKANYANAREQDKVYWYGVIARLIARYQTMINDDFLPKIGATDIKVFPKWEAVKAMIDDLKQKAETARTMRELGIPLTMINERLDLGFDLDGVKDADVPYMPINMVPVGSVGLLSPGTVPEEEPSGTTTGLAASADDIEKARTIRWRNLIAQTADVSRQFESKIRSHFREIGKEVLGNLHSLKGWVAVRGTRTAEDDVNSMMPNKSRIDKRIRRVMAPVYKQTMMRGADSIHAEVSKASHEFFDDPEAIAKLAELTAQIKDVNRTVEGRIRSELLAGLKAGEGERELGARVSDVIDTSRRRGKVIARTETGKAFASARNITMKQVGIKQHQWLSARDTAVRDSHAQEDKSVVDIGKRFPKTRLFFPSDPSGPPEEVINCRCIALPIVVK